MTLRLRSLYTVPVILKEERNWPVAMLQWSPVHILGWWPQGCEFVKNPQQASYEMCFVFNCIVHLIGNDSISLVSVSVKYQSSQHATKTSCKKHHLFDELREVLKLAAHLLQVLEFQPDIERPEHVPQHHLENWKTPQLCLPDIWCHKFLPQPADASLNAVETL